MAPQLSWIEQLPSKQQVVRSNRTGVAIDMIKRYIIIFLFFFNFAKSSDFKLVCEETNVSYDKDFIKSFTKIVNFEQRTVLNYSGNYFDRVVLFNRKEIVFYNNIFEISSTFNIKTKIWTSYKGLFIKIYKCDQKKRRFQKKRLKYMGRKIFLYYNKSLIIKIYFCYNKYSYNKYHQ